MTAMDVIRGFWGGDGKTAAQQHQAAQASQQAAGAQPGAATNTQVPSSATPVPSGTGPVAFPAAATGDASPLANYGKMWEIEEGDRKPTEHAIQFPVDPKKILEATSQFDYTKQIDPELMTKATSGDTAAMVAIINRTAQLTAANATHTTAQVVNEALTRQSEHYKNTIIPQVLRDHSTRSAVREGNPLFELEAAKPVLSMIEDQLMVKYPKASPEEIKQHAARFATEFGEAAITASGRVVIDKPAVPPGTPKEMNWDEWGNR